MRTLWRRRKSLPFITRSLWQKFPCPPEYPGATPSVRRWLNYARLIWAWTHVDSRLHTFPARLCIEASAACNLACPHCFTGAGERSRERATLTPAFFTQLLDEMGAYLWQIEFHNWGEPLLNKHLFEMVAAANARGISTTFNTNFSLPFDAARAEALVRSGLCSLGVSIDGARQETYEQYRVKGRLDVVLDNCRLVVEAKRRLGSRTPRMIWCFHMFSFNVDDVPAAAAQAAALGMDFHVSRGRVVGPDWDPDERAIAHEHVEPIPCYTLYHTAVVFADGSVAACRGSFYAHDDMGRIAADGRPGAASFCSVWDGERFRTARRLFAVSTSAETESADEQRHICARCPARADWLDFLGWRSKGGARDDWKPPHDSNVRYNYFWERRHAPTDASRLNTDSFRVCPRSV
jgi:MoaA/NifB/PqqE/SkfB family radical SAM enzyme